MFFPRFLQRKRARIPHGGGAAEPSAPDRQGQGYGTDFLDHALQKAACLGCGAVCIEGNIGFYGKLGFTPARTFGLRYHGLPEGTDDSFFLGKELIPGYLRGITGEYAAPPGYFMAEEEAEIFDQTFPPLEKKTLPGQIF